jgi:hypothetical protein
MIDTLDQLAREAAEAAHRLCVVAANRGVAHSQASIEALLAPFLARAYNAGLERAAVACGCLASDVVWDDAPDDCYKRAADVIRGLKEKA